MKSRHRPPQKRLDVQWKSDWRKPQAPTQNYDSDTGQVFDEIEVVFKKRQSSDWIGELKTPSIAKKPRPSQSGPRSLADMAKQKCVTEFRNFTPQHFEAIPWSLATEIWARVISTHRESFHAWRTLASVYNQEDEFGNLKHRYHLEIKQPPLPIQEYFRGLSSPKPSWGLALRVSPKQVSLPDLVALANITNLTVLDLSDGQLLLDPIPSRLDERIFRTWAELASSDRAFKQLEVLMFGWQDSIAGWIFKYLDHFPCLRLIIATDCKEMHQKNRTEWEQIAISHHWTAQHAKRSAKLLRPMLDDKDFHIAAISSLYYQTSYRVDAYDETYTNKMKANDRLPVVECWLGTPRRWTHILDEFPGTRTIWLEKTNVELSASDSLVTTNDIDSTKRERDTGSPSQAVLSPPRKKPQGGRFMRPKTLNNTAARLLADMNT